MEWHEFPKYNGMQVSLISTIYGFKFIKSRRNYWDDNVVFGTEKNGCSVFDFWAQNYNASLTLA